MLIKHSCVIKGVESERCPSFSAALEAGKPVHTAAQPTLADGSFMQLYFTIVYGSLIRKHRSAIADNFLTSAH